MIKYSMSGDKREKSTDGVFTLILYNDFLSDIVLSIIIYY